MTSVLSLFSGAGGLDLGLHQAGFAVDTVVENWRPAQAVLQARFPDAELREDVVGFTPDTGANLLAAGFPCVDISQVGSQTGLDGERSGLVSHVFRIARLVEPEWILLENVANILRVQRGAAMASIVSSLESLGYDWAYRVIDARFTGLAQRRRRFLLLASRTGASGPALLGQVGHEALSLTNTPLSPAGFYWTEGRNGVGLVGGAVPTIKAGSTIGLGSAPAVFDAAMPLGRRFQTPTFEALEALQGFPVGWTDVDGLGHQTERNRLIGNAVPVPVGEWVGHRMRDHNSNDLKGGTRLGVSSRWPNAAFGAGGVAFEATAHEFPQRPEAVQDLRHLLGVHGGTPLSARASLGFLARVRASGSRVPSALLDELQAHAYFIAGGARSASDAVA